MIDKYRENNYNIEKTGRYFGVSGNALKKNLITNIPLEWEKLKKEKELRKYKKCKYEKCENKINKKDTGANYCSDECKIKARKMCIYEGEKIIYTLEKNNNNVAKTARELNLSRKGLTKWIKRNIKKEK